MVPNATASGRRPGAAGCLSAGKPAQAHPPLPPPCQGQGAGRGRGKHNHILAACGDTVSRAVCRTAPPNQMGACRAKANTLPSVNRYAIRHDRWKVLRAPGVPVAGERLTGEGGAFRSSLQATAAKRSPRARDGKAGAQAHKCTCTQSVLAAVRGIGQAAVRQRSRLLPIAA
jgi:hypothetical protein